MPCARFFSEFLSLSALLTDALPWDFSPFSRGDFSCPASLPGGPWQYMPHTSCTYKWTCLTCSGGRTLPCPGRWVSSCLSTKDSALKDPPPCPAHLAPQTDGKVHVASGTYLPLPRLCLGCHALLISTPCLGAAPRALTVRELLGPVVPPHDQPCSVPRSFSGLWNTR